MEFILNKLLFISKLNNLNDNLKKIESIVNKVNNDNNVNEINFNPKKMLNFRPPLHEQQLNIQTCTNLILSS